MDCESSCRYLSWALWGSLNWLCSCLPDCPALEGPHLAYESCGGVCSLVRSPLWSLPSCP